MTTEDIALPETGEWVAIPLTTELTVITNSSTRSCALRFGITSTSNGMLLPAGQTILVDETVYIRPQNPGSDVMVCVLRVTR